MALRMLMRLLSAAWRRCTCSHSKAPHRSHSSRVSAAHGSHSARVSTARGVLTHCTWRAHSLHADVR
jgi:hypothetical protein